MNEIGGYLGLEQLKQEPYYTNLISLNSARNSLLYILMARKVKKIFIPIFICDSVTDVLRQYGYDFHLYQIDENFKPIFDQVLKKDEYLYIVNFYGQLTNHDMKLYKKAYGNIIIDNCHAFFQKPIHGIDTLYSCRKFFGVPDGSYLSTDTLLNEPLEVDFSKERMKHLLGRFEGRGSDYYQAFQNNERELDRAPLMQMSKLTANLLGAIDYQRAEYIRTENYRVLASLLSDSNPLKLLTPRGPYAYPLLTKSGLEIKKKLAAEHIYIPTLWPNVLKDNSHTILEYQYAADILPLPCDQRYGKNQMEEMAAAVLRAVKEVEA